MEKHSRKAMTDLQELLARQRAGTEVLACLKEGLVPPQADASPGAAHQLLAYPPQPSTF